MNLVIFAHVPPPFHGQSYMVQCLLRGLGGDRRNHKQDNSKGPSEESVRCYHVDARLSDGIEDVGDFQIRKLFRVLRYCVEALWCRYRYRADVFYYIPAPPERVPFLRDCIVLLICRPFFRRLIFHWHASGLADWLKHDASTVERRLGSFLLRQPDVSLVLAEALSEDAIYLRSRHLTIAPNGIPDPCSEFERTILPLRRERLARRRKIFAAKAGAPLPTPEQYRILFLAHCTREKGLFDLLEAIAFANQQLQTQKSAVRMHLTVAGAFRCEREREQFASWDEKHPGQVHLAGFVGGAEKKELLLQSDCLCFPSYYPAEAQPVSVIEAMAFGLTIVATAWRGIPEMLPESYPLLVPERDPEAMAQVLVESMELDLATLVRARFRENFTEAHYIARLADAFRLARS